MIRPCQMETPHYYRTPVQDLDALEIVAMCDDLLASAGYRPRESYEYPLWRWLGWFFQEQPPKKHTNKNFLPGSPLITRISKLPPALLEFCKELARERHLGLELYADGNLLTFLKAVYRGDKIPVRRQRQHTPT
jgi:hypothetical protein